MHPRSRARHPRPTEAAPTEDRTVRRRPEARNRIDQFPAADHISATPRCRLRWHARFIRFTCIYHHEILVSTLKYTSPRPLTTLMCARRIRQAPPPVRGSVRTGRTSTALSAATAQQSQCDTLSRTRTSRVAHRVPPRFAISAHKFGEHADVMHSPFLSADEHTISCTKRSTWRSGGDAYFVTPMTPWSTVRSHARM